jgi:hypothetical protein
MLVMAAPVAWAAGDAVDIQIREDTGDRIVLDYTVGAYQLDPVDVDGKTFSRVTLDGEPPLTVAGAPALPHVNRSIVIPHDAAMAVRVLQSDVDVIPHVDVISSKGIIYRCTDPASVPYTFGPAYDKDADYPGPVASLGEPYVLRNQRGAVVAFNPFQYNPATRTLRVYRHATLEVYRVGTSEINVLHRDEPSEEKSLAFRQLYRSHFFLELPPRVSVRPAARRGRDADHLPRSLARKHPAPRRSQERDRDSHHGGAGLRGRLERVADPGVHPGRVRHQ